MLNSGQTQGSGPQGKLLRLGCFFQKENSKLVPKAEWGRGGPCFQSCVSCNMIVTETEVISQTQTDTQTHTHTHLKREKYAFLCLLARDICPTPPPAIWACTYLHSSIRRLYCCVPAVTQPSQGRVAEVMWSGAYFMWGESTTLTDSHANHPEFFLKQLFPDNLVSDLPRPTALEWLGKGWDMGQSGCYKERKSPGYK